MPFPFDIAATVLAAGLLFITAFLVSIYYRRLINAKKEYKEAKDAVRGIVLTFSQRQKEQSAKINNVTYEIAALRSSDKKLTEQIRRQEEKVDKMTSGIKTSLLASKKLAEHMLAVHEKMDGLITTQKELQHQITALDEKYKGLLPEVERFGPLPSKEESVLDRLNETERQVIYILAKEGSKPAPELGKFIGRTREHTARLMKKLFEQGYVDRETYKIPYVYRINETFRKRLEEKKTEAKT